MIGKLAVSACKQVGLKMQTCQTVVSSSSDSGTYLGFRSRISPFGCMVYDANSFGYSRTYTRSCAINTLVVIYLYPVVICYAQRFGIFFAEPAGLNPS